ncbi:hypothetical protein [Candidatus Nitrososphaera gargensis]
MTDTIETCRHLYNDSLYERSCDWSLRVLGSDVSSTFEKAG